MHSEMQWKGVDTNIIKLVILCMNRTYVRLVALGTPSITMFRFNFAAWYEDTYGFRKDTMEDYYRYEKMGFVVNNDKSVYFHYDGNTIPYEVAKKYLVEYWPRLGERWDMAEKAELMGHFAEFVQRMSDRHGRTPKAIMIMLGRMSNF